MDCTTNGCDYTRLGTSRLRKGGDLAATADDIESGMENGNTVSPDSNLFLTSEKKCIFINSFLAVYNKASYYLQIQNIIHQILHEKHEHECH